LNHPGGKFDGAGLGTVGLHFYIDEGRTCRPRLKEIKDLIEGRDNLPAVFGPSEMGLTGVEPTAHIRPAKLTRSHLRDNPFAKSRSPEVRIMNDYRNAVAGQANIQLDSRSAVLQSPLESGQGILRSQGRSAAVADY
jgi:hypothetical protein